jgi:redox-sensitive bicupin YhaK (pirin superfamily)
VIDKVDAQEVFEGDGVVVNRLFPISGRMNFDPFVLWDHFNIAAGHGFPDHPHRGFEAITYMLEGGMHHQDNLGNDSFVNKGGAQIFCAGSGMVHSEMPADKGQSMGVQLWINLPKNLKSIEPSYQKVLEESLPTVNFKGGYYRTIVGDESPIKLHTVINYRHFNIEKEGEFQLNLGQESHAIIYVISGDLTIDEHEINTAQALFIDSKSGRDLLIKAKTSSEFMFASGIPHKQPIYQHGPYVD